MMYKIVFICLSFVLAQESFSAEFPIYQPYGRARDNGVCDALADVERHLKTLDKKMEEKSQQQFVFWNHYLSSMQCALEGKPSVTQEKTVDQLYDMWGAIPGHHTRHHRDFRNVLTQKACDIDRVAMLQKKDQHELSRLREALQAEQAAKHELAQVVLTLTARIASLEGQAQQLSGQFQESKKQTATKISALEREKSVLQGQVGDISGQLSISQQENLKKQVAIQQQIDALHVKQRELEAQKRETQAVITQRDQAQRESAQLRAERDQVRAQLAQAQQQTAAQRSALEKKKKSVEIQLKKTSGELKAVQLKSLEEIQQKIDELNQKQRELDIQKRETQTVKKSVTYTKDQMRKLLRIQGEEKRKMHRFLARHRPRSTSASSRYVGTILRLGIRADDSLQRLSVYGKNHEDYFLMGEVGGNSGVLQTIDFEGKHLQQICVGSSNALGNVSGFSLLFQGGQKHQFGALSSPVTTITVGDDEVLLGLLGMAHECIHSLGFVTTKNTYGPYGDNLSGEPFSITPVDQDV